MHFTKKRSFTDGRTVYTSPIDSELVSFDGRNFWLTLTDEEISEMYFAVRDIHLKIE